MDIYEGGGNAMLAQQCPHAHEGLVLALMPWSLWPAPPHLDPPSSQCEVMLLLQATWISVPSRMQDS